MTYHQWFHLQRIVVSDGAYQFAKAAWKYQEERIAEVRKAERERCILAITKAWHKDPCYLHDLTDAIRAMED